MKYYLRSSEIEAEQFDEDHPEKITLVDLQRDENGEVYFTGGRTNLYIGHGEWIIKYNDMVFDTASNRDFELRFSGHDELKSLKESYDRLLWISGGVSSAIAGYVKDGQYDGKPIAMIEEALDLRKRMEVAEQLILSLGGVIANYRKVRDDFITKQGK